MESASTFRERAGVLAALLIICAYILIGPVEAIGTAWMGAKVVFGEGWSAAMNALAAAAVGFLIGKQTTNGPSVTASLGAGDAGSASATVTGGEAKKPLGP